MSGVEKLPDLIGLPPVEMTMDLCLLCKNKL